MKDYFRFGKYGTDFKRKILGGITTFLSMAYILAANPQVLNLTGVRSVSEDVKMDQSTISAVAVLATLVSLLFMGPTAKYPITSAPGMGLNTFFAFTVVLAIGIPQQVGLTGVLFSGIFFAILVVTGFKEAIVNAIPYQVKMTVSAGIGLFTTFVGLQSPGIIVKNESTLVTLGRLTDPPILLAVFGIVITVILCAIKLLGFTFIGMIITAIVGMFTGLTQVPSDIIGKTPSIESTFGTALEAFKDPSQLLTIRFLIVILAFSFTDFSDTTDTLVVVTTQAGIMKDNKLLRAGKALFSDSSATTVRSVFGTTTTTPCIESTSDIAAGARTGFVSIVTGCCLLLALFSSPLIAVVTSAVTTPALVVVGVLMVANFVKMNWKGFEAAVPASIAIIMMPLSYSIATDITCGSIFYPITVLISKKHKEVHPIVHVLIVLFILYFILVHD